MVVPLSELTSKVNWNFREVIVKICATAISVFERRT
jgi:hypothetical protein